MLIFLCIAVPRDGIHDMETINPAVIARAA